MYFTAEIAGKRIAYQCIHPELLRRFGKYLTGSTPQTDGDGLLPSDAIRVDQRDYETAFPDGDWNEMTEEEEFALLGEKTSDYLMENYNICMFHAVAISYQGKGYLFTAPSGTGKSTHYFYWKLLYGDQVQIINGDKPFLEFLPEGQIMIHPGPWRGKEQMGQEISCPLKGIVYLEQDTQDRIMKFYLPDVIMPLACQICHSRSSVEIIRKAAELESLLLKRIPVYKLKNRGLKSSAELCHRILTGDDHVQN